MCTSIGKSLCVALIAKSIAFTAGFPSLLTVERRRRTARAHGASFSMSLIAWQEENRREDVAEKERDEYQRHALPVVHQRNRPVPRSSTSTSTTRRTGTMPP